MLMWLHTYVERAMCSLSRREWLSRFKLMYFFTTLRWASRASGFLFHTSSIEFRSRERCLWQPAMKSSNDIVREKQWNMCPLLLLSRLWGSNPSVQKRLQSTLTRTFKWTCFPSKKQKCSVNTSQSVDAYNTRHVSVCDSFLLPDN